MEELKNRRIKNREMIEKWQDRRNLVFTHLYLVGRMEKMRDEKLICLIEKKNEKMRK